MPATAYNPPQWLRPSYFKEWMAVVDDYKAKDYGQAVVIFKARMKKRGISEAKWRVLDQTKKSKPYYRRQAIALRDARLNHREKCEPLTEARYRGKPCPAHPNNRTRYKSDRKCTICSRLKSNLQYGRKRGGTSRDPKTNIKVVLRAAPGKKIKMKRTVSQDPRYGKPKPH
jgi:hypothetical protein